MKALLNFFTGFPITWYIIAILAASLSFSLYVLQGKIEDIGGYKVAQESYFMALQSAQKDLEKKSESCKVDDQSVVELVAEKEEVRTKIDDLVGKIQNLKKGIPIGPEKQEANHVQTTNVYGPELIDTSLRILLDQAYCVASPTDSSVCGTAGQSSNLSMQTKVSR